MGESKGRPFDTDLNEAIISAAKVLIAEKGFEGLTVTEIVQLAGTTRAAFYRRYQNFVQLTLDVLFREFPTHIDIDFDTGSLVEDLRLVQLDQLDFFTTPLINRGLNGFLGDARSDDAARKLFLEQFLQPRRDATKKIVDRAIARHEIEEPHDLDLICDLLTGPFIFRVTVPELGTLDTALVEATVDAALHTLNFSQ